jgi:UDP-N-acetylglucosamine--N-acetylmuramyl-(pentapeptide) pyrophosphoryl-undecaprenol N-acetylglucosamine transferase
LLRVLIAGGGTTGHLSPGLAVADVLRSRGAEILFVGTARGPESRIVPQSGFAFTEVDVIGRDRGTLNPRNVRAVTKLLRATVRCRGIMSRFRPNVILGTGGYVSLPAAFAARLAGVPLVLHEQNSIPGLANRVAKGFAVGVGVSFPGSERFFGEGAVVVGNPVRAEIAGLDRYAMREQALDYFKLAADKPTLLVFGGSQGAHSINEAAIGAASELQACGVQVLHLCGEAKLEATNAAISALKLERADADFIYRVVGYTDRMNLAYSSADLALCRAGASTIAELAAVGLPALLVPLPFSLDEDQRHNAEAVVAVGGARMIGNADLSPGKLAAEVMELLFDRPQLEKMSTAIASMARPDAADRLADLVMAASP